MSLSSWIVLGLVAGFIARRTIDDGRRHSRRSAWNRGFEHHERLLDAQRLTERIMSAAARGCQLDG
jgi:hypothetical protein